VATSDQEQKSVLVPQHKRMAMGAPVTGQTMQSGNGSNSKPAQKGGLAQAKKK
jgi:hypothetical protein